MAAATRSCGGDKISVITAAETNQLRSGQGILKRVYVPNVGTTMTVDIYDATSGTTNKIVEYVTADGKANLELNLPFSVGLRVIVGGTAGIVVLVWE